MTAYMTSEHIRHPRLRLEQWHSHLYRLGRYLQRTSSTNRCLAKKQSSLLQHPCLYSQTSQAQNAIHVVQRRASMHLGVCCSTGTCGGLTQGDCISVGCLHQLLRVPAAQLHGPLIESEPCAVCLHKMETQVTPHDTQQDFQNFSVMFTMLLQVHCSS